MEVGMANGRYPFWTHDTVAAAVLAGVGMASLQSKLDRVASELNISAVTAVVHGWPMIALFGALVLLVLHSGGDSPREQESDVSDDIERMEEEARALRDAVGEGLERDEVEEGVLCGSAEWQ
jgi:hypothetical protein